MQQRLAAHCVVLVLVCLGATLAQQQQLEPEAAEESQGEFRAYKSIITYLGTDFIMPDGCPLPECDESSRSCRTERQKVAKDFNECVRSFEGELVQGCVTDLLPGGRLFTIPVYANFCSAYCYEKDLALLNELVECPHRGVKHDIDHI